jgi:RHS repeat-associated protein
VATDGRSLGIAGDPGANTQSFSYDALNRLKASSGLAAGNLDYTYDQDGNRLTKAVNAVTAATFHYDRTDELIDQVTTPTTTFAYDRFGNMTKRAEADDHQTTLAYDVGNRMLSMTPFSGNDATFTFDALGRNRARVSGGVTETYGYEGQSENAVLIDRSTGTDTTAFVADGARLAMNTGSARWSLFDLLGSTAALIDASRAITDAYRYDGFGETAASYPTVGATSNAWRFRGLLDVSPSAAPLYDMVARDYSPGQGAFTSLDSSRGSAQNPLSMNRYLYAEASPATLIDPDGHGVDCGIGETCTEAEWAGDRKRQQEYQHRKNHDNYDNDRGGDPGGSNPPKNTPKLTGPNEVDWDAVNDALSPYKVRTGRFTFEWRSPDKVEVFCRFGLIPSDQCEEYRASTVAKIASGIQIVALGVLFLGSFFDGSEEQVGDLEQEAVEGLTTEEQAILAIETEADTLVVKAESEAGIASGVEDPGEPFEGIGSRRNPVDVPPGTNKPTVINDRLFTGHALDRMQRNGIVPSAVEDTIRAGSEYPGNDPGTSLFYSAADNLSVVIDSASGRVITVRYGPP